MKKTSDKFAGSNALRVLGITPPEERIYRMLLLRNGANVNEIVSRLQIPVRSTQRFLASLEIKGLITHSPDQERRYFAVPADIALEALIARRHGEARAVIAELRESSNSGDANERFLEILSREAAGRVFSQLRRAATSEIRCLERLPMLVSAIDKPDEILLQCLARGVQCRTVSDSELVKAPGSLDRMRAGAIAGERYRIFPYLPFKLLVVDRQAAIIPLNVARPDGPILLVRPCSLLDALSELFEMFWRSGTPFVIGDQSQAQDQAPGVVPSRSPDMLLPLLASGLNDKAIEYELNVSRSTLSRRIVELMESLGATTRFHAGWLAALAAVKADSLTPRE